ncbi:MAG: hypothetical protein ACOH1R_04050 [Luteimonas sp.]
MRAARLHVDRLMWQLDMGLREKVLQHAKRLRRWLRGIETDFSCNSMPGCCWQRWRQNSLSIRKKEAANAGGFFGFYLAPEVGLEPTTP